MISKNKLIGLIGIGLGCIVLGVLFAWFNNQPKTKDFDEEIEVAMQQNSTSLSNQQGSTSFTPPTEQRLTINGITMNNFYHDELTRTGGNVVFFETEEYQLSYVIDRNEFIVTVLTMTFDTTRLVAEKSFLSELGISEQQACELNVLVQNPSIFNPSSNDQPRRLSFCE